MKMNLPRHAWRLTVPLITIGSPFMMEQAAVADDESSIDPNTITHVVGHELPADTVAGLGSEVVRYQVDVDLQDHPVRPTAGELDGPDARLPLAVAGGLLVAVVISDRRSHPDNR